MSAVEQLGELLISSRRGVAFTGAGISTESGLSDFRSPGGIWARHRPVYYDEFLASRRARARYWQMRIELLDELSRAKPNAGHLALARLEELGKLAGLITQNIDGLHQAAGSRRVIELHGTARIVACIECDKEYPPDAVIARVQAGDEAPDCDDCGKPLKSKTISFGQAMPAAEMEDAVRLACEADVFLAIGSSLLVEPAASLPRIAHRAGARLVILNRTETPLDDLAELVIRAPIGQTFSAALSDCGTSFPP